MFFLSRQLWVSDVAHTGERSTMDLTEVYCWVFSHVHRSCLEVVQHQQGLSCMRIWTHS